MQAKKLLLTTALVIGAAISGTAQSATSTTQTAIPEPTQVAAETAQNQANTTQQRSNLPSTGSALPLLSVIGFGVLVGGIASALKTR